MRWFVPNELPGVLSQGRRRPRSLTQNPGHTLALDVHLTGEEEMLSERRMPGYSPQARSEELGRYPFQLEGRNPPLRRKDGVGLSLGLDQSPARLRV